MKNHKLNDEQIKEQLRKLPKMEDKRTKEEIYSQIESKMNQDKVSSQKKRSFVWIPMVATVCAALLIFVIIQGQDFSRSYDQSSSDMADESNVDTFDNSDGETSITEEADIYNKAELQDNINEEYRYLIDMEDAQSASYMAFLTEQAQHIVPITILNSNFSYRQINEYIDLEENGLYDIGIRDIQFERDQQEVSATFTDSFALQPSGSNYSSFEKVLMFMFRPLGIEEVQFENHHPILNEGAMNNNLYPLSSIKQIPYKVYQYSEGSDLLLAAKTDGTFKTLTAALEEMKKPAPEFNVQSSIPEDTVIETEDHTADEVFVSLSSDQIGENQRTVQMIEAILASAATYGYQEVLFSIGIDQIGRYDLTEPIQTTDQINIIQ
ncbi:hypothetical protein GI584_12610 [Gracilibacillus salitolerans]|uniref:GerMN domain-containing protein n=1 Tax=Gracilibacillus salitolerans TaxID=2663022 RepID=A0A5Q2TJF2_9BACI|nr:GerMN domain-containing protein [Gracilibacillus salitolerans]QGH34826.1 hypothetical protein GI584_12610 [Gracilibacillus salitolerans]